MDFKVEQAVLDIDVKIVFAIIEGMDNTGKSEEWLAYREERLQALQQAIRSWI